MKFGCPPFLPLPSIEVMDGGFENFSPSSSSRLSRVQHFTNVCQARPVVIVGSTRESIQQWPYDQWYTVIASQSKQSVQSPFCVTVLKIYILVHHSLFDFQKGSVTPLTQGPIPWSINCTSIFFPSNQEKALHPFRRIIFLGHHGYWSHYLKKVIINRKHRKEINNHSDWRKLFPESAVMTSLDT